MYVKPNTTLFSFFLFFNKRANIPYTIDFHYICLYSRHTHYGISQKQHVFRVYVIHSNCATLHNFFFLYDGLWWKWLFTLKNVSQNDWKLIIEGVGIRMPWVEKKIKKFTIGGKGGEIIRDSRTPEYLLIVSVFHFLNFLNSKQIFLITFLHQYVHLWKRKYVAIFSLQTNTRVNCFHVTEKNILLII